MEIKKQEIITQISICVEKGKVNRNSPYPNDMKGMDGADEVTQKALDNNIGADEILLACNEGMHKIGDRFGKNEVFVPELLMAAKAMNAVMFHLKPFFKSGSVKTKGKFVLGTVAGDLHDIGKNLVAMVVEGNGWEVIDLGIDVKPNKFLDKIKENPGCTVGLSALLTTTMANMAKTVKEIKTEFPTTKVIVGGAPLTSKAAEEMNADGYAEDPQGAVTLLNNLAL